MRFTTRLMPGYLRAEMTGRETAEETTQFIAAVAEEARKHSVALVLVSVRRSRPIFTVEKYRMSEHLKLLAANPGVRVALLADSEELRASHEYIEVLARQQGANVRSFREETTALDWLKAAQSQEKR